MFSLSIENIGYEHFIGGLQSKIYRISRIVFESGFMNHSDCLVNGTWWIEIAQRRMFPIIIPLIKLVFLIVRAIVKNFSLCTIRIAEVNIIVFPDFVRMRLH